MRINLPIGPDRELSQEEIVAWLESPEGEYWRENSLRIVRSPINSSADCSLYSFKGDTEFCPQWRWRPPLADEAEVTVQTLYGSPDMLREMTAPINLRDPAEYGHP